MRIGHGVDVHALKIGLPLVIGGVKISHDKGIVATSDGDVLLHAITDALLGAAALRDMGFYFKDADPRMKNISSRILLREVFEKISQQQYKIINIDATVILQRPRLAPHIDTMRQNIAADLHLDIQQVSVKATTTDHLGYIGEEQGLAAQAVVLIDNK